MKKSTLRALLGLGLAAFALLGASGCDKAKSMLLENRLPEVRLTSAPIDTTGLYYYSVTLNWVGYDPDGRVEYYQYAVDPQLLRPGQDTVWTRTESTEQRLVFQSSRPGQNQVGRAIGTDFHLFLVRAVDNKGALGPYVARAFNSYTIAPSVFITNPIPSSFLSFVTPALRISWRGEDTDGVFTQKPVKYKFILLSASSEFPKDLAISNPDSLRRFYENDPRGAWAGWDSTSAETTQVQYTNLTPNSEYVFAIIGFDEAGAYSPVFSFATNMIRLKVGFAGQLGPRITMYNEFFNYTYISGGYSLIEKVQIPVEVPAKKPVEVSWFAEPPQGADIRAYRWTLDIDNVFDNTPRTNELTDVTHWSSPSANITSATVGPFGDAETHFFYIEAEDNNGLKSLGIIRFESVEPSFEKPLLIVDDTRLQGDTRRTGAPCVNGPAGSWPSRAEMDTFLFARGGVPWRCYGTNSVSKPGLFAGYEFDTLGTLTGRSDLTVKLSVLGKYRHIIWIVDALGASFIKPGTDPGQPSTALRYMGSPGRVNTLAAFVKQGGKVWMNGGGAAYAVSDPWNDNTNDFPTKTYSINGRRNELGPGRFMYDLAKWQSEYRISYADARISKNLGRFRVVPLGGPYAELPDLLQQKTPATDPLATEAPARSSSTFYDKFVALEFLQLDNYIVEDLDPDPDVTVEESTIDTLYRVRAVTLPDSLDPVLRPRYVAMTYYHGPPPRNDTFVMTGFPIWSFQRAQCQQLVDFVLQRLWGFTKGPVMPAARISAASAQMTAPGVMRREAPLGTVPPKSTRNIRD